MAKDTGNTVQDSNVFLAVYNPFRDGLNTYHKWDISQLQSNFRSVLVLKNRFGDCDMEVGMNFFGGINLFSELAKYKIYGSKSRESGNIRTDNTEDNPNPSITEM